MTLTPGLAATLRGALLRRGMTSLLLITFLCSPYGVGALPADPPPPARFVTRGIVTGISKVASDNPVASATKAGI